MDQPTSAEAKNPSLNIHAGCIKVVDTLRTRSAMRIAASRPGALAPLSGLVLIVEDNVLIALDVEDVLIALGAARAVVASTVTEALRLIDLETPSFALLDINLGRETSWPIATRLRSLGVHYIFATGYGDGIDYPVEHRLTVVITKPYTSVSIAQAFGQG